LATYVSAQHAVIRWNGRRWELLDRGSRNGTRLNGKLVEARRPYELGPGAIVAFGHEDERWSLHDDGPPEAMLVALDSGEVLSGAGGVIGIPSKAQVECTAYVGAQGVWQLERPDGTVAAIEDGEVFVHATRSYRFCCPSAVSGTRSSVPPSSDDGAQLHFRVSNDEESVELSIEYPSHRVSLGSRSHNYLLLTLAEARLRDSDSGVRETACGWVDKEDLAGDLRMSPPQIDGEIFRIRGHFGKLGLPEVATIIERRPGTRQLRIGLKRLRIERT
jgi:hypothetical protein